MSTERQETSIALLKGKKSFKSFMTLCFIIPLKAMKLFLAQATSLVSAVDGKQKPMVLFWLLSFPF